MNHQLHDRFPGIKKFLKAHVLGPESWETQDIPRLARYAAEGDFTYPSGFAFVGNMDYSFSSAETGLSCVGLALRWRAIQSALAGTQGHLSDWIRSTAFLGLASLARLEIYDWIWRQYQAGHREQNMRMTSFSDDVSSLSSLVLLGWHTRARTLYQALARAVQRNGYYYLDDQGKLRQLQVFALQLIARALGEDPPATFGLQVTEPDYAQLLERLQDPGSEALVELLLSALNRRTHQSRLTKRNAEPAELPDMDDWYFPYEVSLFMQLRQAAGLPTPTADQLKHPLTATPLWGPWPAEPVYTQPLLLQVQQRLQVDLPGLPAWV